MPFIASVRSRVPRLICGLVAASLFGMSAVARAEVKIGYSD